ncbi:MAG: MoaD/ThiS family protein [Euryarchaeota archaeon]|nr:MoaD/ThiS family protein [Euryarchaeota archaeon]
MKIRLTIGNEGRDIVLPDDSTVERLFASLTLLPDTHIILRRNVPISIDESLREGDEIKIIRVASGG